MEHAGLRISSSFARVCILRLRRAQTLSSPMEAINSAAPGVIVS